MNKITAYNLRVYGILLNNNNEVLLSNEEMRGYRFTKFPGGGHELGESLVDCLKREFREELGINVEVKEHLYTTDFFQQSAFDEQQQLISVYYWVHSDIVDQIEDGQLSKDLESHRNDHFVWRKIDELSEDELTYPIDKKVVDLIKAQMVLSTSF